MLADHETGGLWLGPSFTREDILEIYEYPNLDLGRNELYGWTTGGHTSNDINCYINGADIDFSKYSFGSNYV